jgi:hypothetical protein
LPRSQGRNWVCFQPCIFDISFSLTLSYIIERLPEGGEGAHGYDDGEGDD